ncbi:MAG: four helix bundle protein [Acidimicrobiia bacterium]
MHDFTRLDAWSLGHELTLKVYAVTKSFPMEERFGLVSQMRRAAVSIPSNIAEGAGRDSDADFARFVSMAVGSASELLYRIRLASDLGYVDARTRAELETLAISARRVADRFAQSLRRS